MVAILLGHGRMLMARAEPGDHSDVVHRFGPTANDLTATGRAAQLGSQTWVEVETPHGDAWVDGTYVTAKVGTTDFASDQRPVELVRALRTAIAEEGDIRPLTVPQGLYVAHHASPELITSDELDGILCSSVERTWWDSTGETPLMSGTFCDVIARPLATSLDAYELAAGGEPSTPVPAKVVNLPSLGVAHPDVPGKDAWRVFFDYGSGEPRIFAIWKDAPFNPRARIDPN